MRFISLLLLAFAGSSASASSRFGEGWAKPSLQSPHWPAWAHEHWVWENEGTEDSAEALVNGYLSRGIPVSALIVDRPWDVAPSNFTPDPKRYPGLRELVQRLHSRNVKLMLWAVSVLNREAPEFAYAQEQGFFLNGGRLVPWWGGRGAMLDYGNPRAVDWWHSRMNQVLDLGIDGWKLDGTDPFSIYASVNGIGSLLQMMRIWGDYSKAYYGDFYHYSRERTGKKIVVTARPVDSFNNKYLPRLLDPFYAFAPYELSFAGWVGDQDGNWAGLRAAIANMKESARRGFLSFGSDTSGFRSSGGLREKELFVRWTQLSAFNGVFENGGSGEHRPWIYGPEVEALYRRFAVLHHALVPYLYSSAAWAFENHGSLYRNFEQLGVPSNGKWSFLLGPALAVSAIDAPGAAVNLQLPKGDWLGFLEPAQLMPAGRFVLQPSIGEYPVFVRDGSIFPLRDLAGLGPYSSPAARDGGLNVILFPREGTESFPVYHEEKGGGTLGYELRGRLLRVSARNVDGLSWLRVNLPSGAAPRTIRVQGREAHASEWRSGAEAGQAGWLSLAACEGAESCRVELEL